MGLRFMDKPPTDPKRSAKHEDAPEQLDPKLRRIAICGRRKRAANASTKIHRTTPTSLPRF